MRLPRKAVGARWSQSSMGRIYITSVDVIGSRAPHIRRPRPPRPVRDSRATDGPGLASPVRRLQRSAPGERPLLPIVRPARHRAGSAPPSPRRRSPRRSPAPSGCRRPPCRCRRCGSCPGRRSASIASSRRSARAAWASSTALTTGRASASWPSNASTRTSAATRRSGGGSREARVLRSWSHENVVAVYDFVERDHLLAIVMEYVDGSTLVRHLERWRGRIPSRRSARCSAASSTRWTRGTAWASSTATSSPTTSSSRPGKTASPPRSSTSASPRSWRGRRTR